jgi:hypothetical protein
MSYDLRTIAFAAEILYPPQQLRADLVQGVHNTLYRQPAIGYQNFQVAPDGIHLSNLPLAPGQISSATFAWDRLALREELRGGSVEDFATRVVNVTQTAFQALSIPTTLMQQFVVRSLIAPRHFRDGREFLGKRLVAPGTEAWQSFGRALHSLGSLDDEFTCDRSAPWPAAVERLVQQRLVAHEALPAVQLLYAFGVLIANTDMHMGNLSFLSAPGRACTLAPAYDMLPMALAPSAAGALRDTMAPLQLPACVPLATWHPALVLAREWCGRLQAASTAGRLSASFEPALLALHDRLVQAASQVARIAA